MRGIRNVEENQIERIKPWIPVSLAFLISVFIALYYRVPIGEDIHFHLKIVQEFVDKGILGWFSDTAMQQNKMPYPPFLHIVLLAVPPIVIQCCLFPLAVWSFSRLYTGKDRLLAGVLVMGSYAYIDRVIQVNPQAITMILLPLAIRFYLNVEENKSGFIAASSLMIWNHGLVALSCLGGMFFLMLNRRQYKVLALILLLSSPVLATTIYYLPASLGKFSSGFENNQERQFWNNPSLFTALYQRLISTGFILVAALLMRRRAVTEMEKVSLMTLLSMALMVIPWADRFVQFSTIPLSILIMEDAAKRKWKGREAWTWAITLCFMLMYLTLWLWLIADAYYIAS